MKLPQNFTRSQKSYFLKYNWNFWDNCFFPINFMEGICEESTFSFCQLWAVEEVCFMTAWSFFLYICYMSDWSNSYEVGVQVAW